MAPVLNNTGIYQKRRMWVLIGMLMLVIIIPTVCLIWFVSEAVRNEGMAVRQKLTDLYQSQMESLPPGLQTFWEEKLDNFSGIGQDMSPSERFKEIIENGLSDSVLLYDSGGELLYPCEVEPPDIDLTDFVEEWDRAESSEFKKKDDLAAAELYADIAVKAEDTNLKARASQRQIRCLIKAGKKDAAVIIVAGFLGNPRYEAARDNNGRLIVPDAQLFVLQSMKEHTLFFRSVLENLISRVKDYSPPVMPSSQRLFLMKALKEIDQNIEFSTFNAEELASSSKLNSLPSGQFGLAKVTEETGLWLLASPDFSVVALFKQDFIERESNRFIESKISHEDADFLFVRKEIGEDTEPILRMAAGAYFPDWELIVQIRDDDVFKAASERRIQLYTWSAMLIIAGILILAVITARLFMRQMTLSRMKNDLITTVSHELKTPLTSIQLLIDTLVDDRHKDKGLETEYHELIARETERLTKLVENFLTFSRIEDKRQTFHFKIVETEKIIASVYDSIKHRFEAGGFTFDLKVADKIPPIVADQDAISMVLLNLLDNAYQYSGNVKSVTLEAYPEKGNVCFKVRDKGIGMSAEARKKILKPFYQVDQTLSRRGSGFGLGLSIVKSIVDVHDGSMEIESEPGKGSTFIIKIPNKGN